MPRKSAKKEMNNSQIEAYRVLADVKRLLESAKSSILTAAIISRESLSKKQRKYIKAEIKKDTEFKMKIEDDVKLIGACAKNTLRHLIDREAGK